MSDAHDEAAKALTAMPTIKGLIRLWEQAESGKAFADEMMFLLNKVADKAAADGAKAAYDSVVVKLSCEHMHEDDLIAWLEARAKGGA